jgi:phage terminase large subunit GpA-like protein
MAIKGFETGEIYRQPKPIDPGRKLSKAARYGLQVYAVGTEKAKDLIIGFGENGGRLRLSGKNDAGDIVTGSGPGRIHWYEGIRGDFYAQVTAEVKGPKKGRPRDRIYWQVKAGVRNEGLDCLVYGLHASRKLRINLWTEAQWMLREQKLRQPDLIGQAASVVIPAQAGIYAAAETEMVEAGAAPEAPGADVIERPAAPVQTRAPPRPRADPRLAHLDMPADAGADSGHFL